LTIAAFEFGGAIAAVLRRGAIAVIGRRVYVWVKMWIKEWFDVDDVEA
jgi:hypothetical protein